MSGEGHLRECERMLDAAIEAWIKAGEQRLNETAIYNHGIARGIARVTALIGGTNTDHEFDEAERRVRGRR